jgi:AcrR family transcriptional regulator
MPDGDPGARARPVRDTTPVDGRLLRSERTRQAIIKAYLDLVREDLQMPVAAAVARRAGCSVRSVFERFTDMGQLGLAAIDHVVGLGLSTPVGDMAEADRHSRLNFQIRTRARNCETWLPFWRVLVRHQNTSEKVATRIDYVRGFTRRRLQLMYRPELAVLSEPDRENILIALEAVTDFEAWGRMREHYGLSFEEACAAWRSTIDRLLPPTPSDR